MHTNGCEELLESFKKRISRNDANAPQLERRSQHKQYPSSHLTQESSATKGTH